MPRPPDSPVRPINPQIVAAVSSSIVASSEELAMPMPNHGVEPQEIRMRQPKLAVSSIRPADGRHKMREVRMRQTRERMTRFSMMAAATVAAAVVIGAAAQNPPRQVSIVVSGGTVITVDGAADIFDPGAVAIDGNT